MSVRWVWGIDRMMERDEIFTLIVFLFASSATDLINNLLQVKMRKRYSVDKSLSHPWLQVELHTILI